MMTYRYEAWRRKIRWWVIPLAVCLINTVAAAVYRIKFAGNVEALQTLVESASEELGDLKADKEASLQFLDRVDQRREAIKTLYGVHFSTKRERLTDMIRQVKDLAQQAGLRPTAINYPETELVEGELAQRRMIFPVEGTYDQLRHFINFLELHDQFLTLERVSLAGAADASRVSKLSIDLELSTIFVAEESDRRREGGAS